MCAVLCAGAVLQALPSSIKQSLGPWLLPLLPPLPLLLLLVQLLTLLPPCCCFAIWCV